MDVKGLIVGLGNPGPQYAATRHNVGFMVIDAVLAEIAEKPYRRCMRLTCPAPCELWAVSLPRVKGDFLLAKPMTYMNLSGQAVMAVCKGYGVKPAGVLVIHDELDLPFGRLRLKTGGGTAGHNGLASIVELLGTADFTRLRLGIGRPAYSGQVRDYVLSPFSEAEAAHLPAALAAGRDVLPVLFARGISAAQQVLHPFDALPPAETPAAGGTGPDRNEPPVTE